MKVKTIFRLLLGAWIALLALLAMTGCATRRVTSSSTAHDTLRTMSRDTLCLSRTESRTDTLRIETERTYILSPTGDTARTVIWRDRWRTHYDHATDTLRETIRDTVYLSRESEEREVVATIRRTPLRERLAVCAVVIAFTIAAVACLKKRG